MTRVNLHGAGEADSKLGKFADAVLDWRPFWRELGADLAREAQERWPLRRRTGRLRRSLQWAGNRLGRGGVFESSPDKLTFGSAIFYGRFHQRGSKRTQRRELIHINEPQHAQQLDAWLRKRAEAAGLEVT